MTITEYIIPVKEAIEEYVLEGYIDRIKERSRGMPRCMDLE